MVKIITPAITVFNDSEKPDITGNKKVIDFLVNNGVDGILVLGSAGEFPNLTLDEKIDFFKFYFEYTAGRVELYAGTGCMNYKDTKVLTQKVNEIGYNSSMIISPYYYSMTQKQIFNYYDKLASSIDNGFYLYNFPARSGNSISAETVSELVKSHSNILGLKDSVTGFNHTNEVFQLINTNNFEIFSGFDNQLLLNLSNNGGGCIGALSNVVPDIWSKLILEVKKGDYDKVIFITGLIQRLMILYNFESNPSVLFKKLMAHRGVDISDQDVFPFKDIDGDRYSKAERTLDDVLKTFNRELQVS